MKRHRANKTRAHGRRKPIEKEMKNTLNKTLVLLAMALCAFQPGAHSQSTLVKRFVQPPSETRPWCYWYWMNGNITKEGIVADLQGMQDVGVGGVLLFDIGIHPKGPIVNRSREWYDLVKLAVAEAQKRNIKISFHCPGWSASGGPWIKPEQGMQELTWSETVIEGTREFSERLAEPAKRLDFFRDVAVFAFPTPGGEFQLPQPQVSGTDGKRFPQGAAAFDGNMVTAASLPTEFDFTYPQEVEIRSLCVRARGGDVRGQLLAWDEANGRFRPVASLRGCTSGPFSDQISSASFAPVRASKFRLTFNSSRPGARMNFHQVDVIGGFRMTDWPMKTGFATDPVAPHPKDMQPQAAEVIALNRIVDLTHKMAADGTLTWSVPAGRWTIVRLGYTPTGVHIAPAPLGGDGLECDKMSREVADFHYDQCVTPVLKELGPELAQKALAYYHIDSYEAGWQNWTDSFPKEFSKRRGYDLRRYLPALTGRVVGDITTTEQFLWDFRRTIGDLYADNHYGRMAERCHADGLGFSTEPYGGPFEFLQVGLRADHPMMEFWVPTNPKGRKFMAESVSVGHSGEKAIIGAESFTSGPPEERWNSHPFSLKPLGDYIYACGVNRFVIHVSAHQPLMDEKLKPGFTCGCNGIHFDRNNTWWNHGAKEWLDYLTRCQSLLQAGEPVADALYFLGNDSPYGCGPFQPSLPEGYDYDACNSEVLSTLKVQEGQITLPKGKRYRYLVLPPSSRVTLASLRKIAELARDGARLVGPMPKESPSLTDVPAAAEYGRLLGELAGRIQTTNSFAPILAADGLAPDFAFNEEAGLAIHAMHRRIDEADVYFVASASPLGGVVDCRFRVSGKVPELWRPDAGTMEPCTVYEEVGGITRIPLRFDPAGSVFVVFRKGTPTPHAVNVTVADAAKSNQQSAVVIRSADYGAFNDPQKRVDVTKQLAARMRDGKLKLNGFSSLAGDPAPGVVKTLRVEYDQAGKTSALEAKDGTLLRLPPLVDNRPPCELQGKGPRLELRAWEAGQYNVILPDHRTATVTVPGMPAPQTIPGPWKVQFPAGWGAPEQITLDRLISWPDHSDEGVRYFSGTAIYRTKFKALNAAPRSRIELDLGQVEVTAEVTLNGKPLGTLWKPPFVCDVTDVLRSGENELEVRITNLWTNRLIGDEEYPDDLASGKWGGIPTWPEWLKKAQPRPEPRRQTFFTWKHYQKGEPLLPSGLLGPVLLRNVQTVPVAGGHSTAAK